MKVKRKFNYCGITLQIVERQEYYLNSSDTIPVTRVIAPNGGSIPITIKHKQTLKSIEAETVRTLENFKSLGANVLKELTQPLK